MGTKTIEPRACLLVIIVFAGVGIESERGHPTSTAGRASRAERRKVLTKNFRALGLSLRHIRVIFSEVLPSEQIQHSSEDNVARPLYALGEFLKLLFPPKRCAHVWIYDEHNGMIRTCSLCDEGQHLVQNLHPQMIDEYFGLAEPVFHWDTLREGKTNSERRAA